MSIVVLITVFCLLGVYAEWNSDTEMNYTKYWWI